MWNAVLGLLYLHFYPQMQQQRLDASDYLGMKPAKATSSATVTARPTSRPFQHETSVNTSPLNMKIPV
eukprot:COSAG02_NODE_4342_length_5477_cov_3.682968_1_plen_68_part_00